jgi:hypothetical protein
MEWLKQRMRLLAARKSLEQQLQMPLNLKLFQRVWLHLHLCSFLRLWTENRSSDNLE